MAAVVTEQCTLLCHTLLSVCNAVLANLLLIVNNANYDTESDALCNVICVSGVHRPVSKIFQVLCMCILV